MTAEFKPHIRLEAKTKGFGFFNNYSFSDEGIAELKKDIEFLEKIIAQRAEK